MDDDIPDLIIERNSGIWEDLSVFVDITIDTHHPRSDTSYALLTIDAASL